jgi:tRNA pseudouridine55 synthase
MPESSSGLLLLDKPSGPTSFDCVRQVKRILHERRVGHCGTLDPIAEGVLVILFGSATRRQDEFLGMEKQYWFRAELGRITETGDRAGRCEETLPYSHVTRKALEDLARTFIGDQWQIPPRVSAIKYQGKRLYDWAREGIAVPRPPRQISIKSFDILSFEGAFWEARVVCSRGTYIRSLAEDIARKLDTGALIDALTRERVGIYKREQAVPWTRLMACSREDLLQLVYA